MVKRIVSIVAFTLVTLYLVAGFTVLNSKPTDWVCNDLHVITDTTRVCFITSEEVISILKTNRLYPINKPADSIDSRLIEQTLLKNPYVRRVECYKTPYNSLCIHVEQRLPILRILSSSGQNYYIDHLGDVMPASASSACRLTVATGHIETEFAHNELYEFACLLRERPFWDKQIQQINITPQGEIELIPRVGNHILFLGHPTDLSEKLNRLEIFYSKVLGQIGWNKYSRISVEFDNQVICKRWE
ncbi:MAG: cell division protein FtsQ [Bacteroidaceae bacterium]|nr:cell division protein FtsQ [Bacteroidaceae bacterium]